MENADSKHTIDTLLHPAIDLVECCHHHRNCPELSDESFVQFMVERCLSNDESGRDHLQVLHGLHEHDVSRADYFQAINSPRRWLFVEELSNKLEKIHRHKLIKRNDPFADIDELEGREIHAGDGVWIEHATHDPRSVRKGGKSYVPIGHFYVVDLRTGWMTLLGSSTETRKVHDITVMKQADPEVFSKGKKNSIVTWDRACIDFNYWFEMKEKHGVTFITRTKDNLNITVFGNFNGLNGGFDSDDPINEGVIADELVGAGGSTMRMVTYRDPETHQEFEFLTNEHKIRPGVVACIHRHRWDIEKRFDQTKNKQHETKAWVKSREGKMTQARFAALAHNLMLIFQDLLETKYGLREKKVEKRFKENLERRKKKAKELGRFVPKVVELVRRKPTQITLQFIRHIRQCLHVPRPLSVDVVYFRALMESYL